MRTFDVTCRVLSAFSALSPFHRGGWDGLGSHHEGSSLCADAHFCLVPLRYCSALMLQRRDPGGSGSRRRPDAAVHPIRRRQPGRRLCAPWPSSTRPRPASRSRSSTLPNDDLPTKLKNAAQADDLPALARAGGVDPVWRDVTIDLKSIADGNNVRKDLCAVDEDGKVLSLPSDVTAVGLFLNKSLFDRGRRRLPDQRRRRSGPGTTASPPSSRSRVKAGTSYGMVMDRSSHRLKAFLYEFGSTGFQPGTERPVPAPTTATKTALEYFKNLNDDKFMPRSVWLQQRRRQRAVQERRRRLLPIRVLADRRLRQEHQGLRVGLGLPAASSLSGPRTSVTPLRWSIFDGTGQEQAGAGLRQLAVQGRELHQAERDLGLPAGGGRA